MRTLFLAAIWFVASGFSAELSNSVVPIVEKFEEVSSLTPKFYSKHQLAEITEALAHKEERLRYVSYNFLRNDLEPKDNATNHWVNRLPRIVAALSEMNPDIIGCQELSSTQVDDLVRHLGETYYFFGKARNDGEINGFFYRKERLEALHGDGIKIPNMKKDQTLNHLQFKDLQTGKIFSCYNMHMSFGGSDNRDTEARFVSEITRDREAPAIFSADANTFPNWPGYPFPFYDGDHVMRLLSRHGMKDSQEISLLGHVGPLSTYTNQPPSIASFEGVGTPGVVLDHILVSPDITVLIHATQSVQVDSHFPSDHMPVFIDFYIP